jgi:hypothetical protein
MVAGSTKAITQATVNMVPVAQSAYMLRKKSSSSRKKITA